MALSRLLLTALGVFFWLSLWAAGLRRFGSLVRLTQSPPAPWPRLALEAVLLTLFAALWFASLGHGGWVLLFLLLGLLMELPPLVPGTSPAGLPWQRAAFGVARIVGAGGILALGLG